jgi:two-component system OmpR family response regulator
MDDFELFQHLHHLENAPPVIVLTAKDDMVTRAEALSLGVSEFIVKPVNPRALIARIHTLLLTQ